MDLRLRTLLLVGGAMLFASSLTPRVAEATAADFAVLLDGTLQISPGDPDGTGSGTVSVDDVTGAVSWNISYQDIDTVIQMHLHGPANPGMFGSVVVDMPIQTTGPAGTLIWSTVHSPASDLTDVIARPHKYYINIHTQQFGAGAIRGHLFVAPAVPSLRVIGGILLGAALLAVSIARLHRKTVPR